ncbi:MAG: excinuclease ABC subunit UvrA, partial [Verrucomicrobiota bacterium]
VYGAQQHNLKNINVTLPRRQLTVITGLSGSGKSSLAFDTLYAEGQRRYVESLSAFARQFLEQLQKPRVERVDGLSPAIAIEQRSGNSSPRSTVATTTEIHDYLRLLYAHAGKRHCPHCGRQIAGKSAETIVEHLIQLAEGRKMVLLAPYAQNRKGDQQDIIQKMRRDGFVRGRFNGKIHKLDEDIALAKTKPHTIEAVVDRLISGRVSSTRLMDSIELALRIGEGSVSVLIEDKATEGGWREEVYNERLTCEYCQVTFDELLPRDFSFNSPYGACPRCHGLGNEAILREESVIPDPALSIKNGAIPLWRRGPRRLITYYNRLLRALAEHYDFSLQTPWKDLPKDIRRILLYGSGDENISYEYRRSNRRYKANTPFEGIIPNLMRRYRESASETVRRQLQKAMDYQLCSQCDGARLRPESLAVTVNGLSIHAFCQLPIDEAAEFIDSLELPPEETEIAGDILREISSRLQFLRDVGLGYITLNRPSNTLSGGEAQRTRLATQLGSGLAGVMYVLDEPTIGLHQRDIKRLIDTLKRLRDLGNTVIVVEHDPAVIEKADHVVDLGPGAGINGGNLIFSGSPENLYQAADSLTAQYLTGREKVPVPETRCSGNGEAVKVIGATEHNLANLNVSIPLATITCVSGVSGSGKSTLVDDVIRKGVSQHFNLTTSQPGAYKRIDGLDKLHKIIVVDQSPIGRTPRSNPATYTGVFSIIRRLFAQTPEARARGFKPGRFSFNIKGGRCEECRGDGIKKIEMTFLPDVHVQCERCRGRRYNRETLNILYRGRNIAEVLALSVDEALDFFKKVPSIRDKLQRLTDVGLGYLQLGQPATTLSGGEAQRVKLAAELARKPYKHTLYILDEPTTGLHSHDIRKLIKILQELRNQDNTVLIIEHNLDILKIADHIIDLGPEGGDQGGRVVATGTPEEIAASNRSYTGLALVRYIVCETSSF